MSTFLTEAIPVARAGSLGYVGNFNLYDSTEPNVVLYVTKEPRLIPDANGRYAVAVTSFTQQQPDRSMKITGGSAMFSITSAVELDQRSIDEAKQKIASLGVADPGPLTLDE